jgi:hypothetical protein
VTLTDAVIRTELGTRPNPRHALLPTPVASDGTKSGPNQRGGWGSQARLSDPPAPDPSSEGLAIGGIEPDGP